MATLAGLLVLQNLWLETLSSGKRVVYRRQVNEMAEMVIAKFHQMETMRSYELGDEDYQNLSKKLDSIESLIRVSMINTYSDRYIDIKGKALRNWIIVRDSLTLELHKKFLQTLHAETDQMEDAYYSKHGYILNYLIAEELANRDIDLDFTYGIYDPDKRIFLYLHGSDPDVLLNTKFQYVLNADDIFFSPKYLLIHFPKGEAYLLSQMRGILIVCILLSVVIIAVLAYAVTVIIRYRADFAKQQSFYQDMTHDFKTPLTTIMLCCEALEDSVVQSSGRLVDKYVAIVTKESKRLQNMVEKVLYAAKTNNSEFTIDKKPLSIETILTDAITAMQLQIDEKKAIVTTDFMATNPQIAGDKMYLINVFINIIDNALKYSKDEECRINITTQNEHYGVIICIEDNGIGMNKLQQKHIFDKLYRSDSPKVQRVKGFGLGLNYVKIMVEKHNGAIRVESEPEKWTKLYIYIPNHLNT